MFLIASRISRLTLEGLPKLVKNIEMIIFSHLTVKLVIWLILTPFEFSLGQIQVSYSNNDGFFVEVGIGYLLRGKLVMNAMSLGVTLTGYINQNLTLWYLLIMNLDASSLRSPKGHIRGTLR